MMKPFLLKLLSCLVFVGCFVFSAEKASADQASPLTLTLTLTDTIKTAFEKNPILQASEAAVEEAYFGYKAAGALQPLLLAGNYTGGTNTFVPNNGQAQDVFLEVSQSLGPIGSVGLSGRVGYQGYRIAQAASLETRLSFLQSIKDNFYGLLASQEQLKVAHESLDLADKIYDLVRKKYDAGAAPQTDLVNAEIQRAASEQAFIQAGGVHEQALAALNTVLARPVETPLEVTGDLELKPLESDLASLMKFAEGKRPVVNAAKITVEQAKTSVRLARSWRNPAPSFFYTYDITTRPLYLFGVSLQFPVFDYGSLGNNVKAQEKTVLEKENNLRSALLALSSSVKSSYEAYKTAYNNSAVYKQKVLSPSEKLLAMAEYGYTRGALAFVQLLQAEQNLKTVRTQYINFLLAGHQALDQLDTAAGRSLEEIKHETNSQR